MTEATSNGFRTTLANFTGPLDLLLYLIRKSEIDILDIPIADVLGQYEEYVGLLRDIDVNLASDYLVMASTLMEIKSRMLLPEADAEGEEEVLEDPRESLVRQLLEYREYKERALSLAHKLKENKRRYRRPSLDGGPELDSIELGKVSVWDLVTAFLRIQKAIAADRPGDIVYTERPLTFYMELIQETFDRHGDDVVPFDEIFLGCGTVDRYILVGIFLAILEFVKLGALGVAQGATGGEIVVRRRIPNLTACMGELAKHEGFQRAGDHETGDQEADTAGNGEGLEAAFERPGEAATESRKGGSEQELGGSEGLDSASLEHETRGRSA